MNILSPAEQLPWTVTTPFKMRPGLSRLEAEAPPLFIRDELAADYSVRKQALWATAKDKVQAGEADPAVLALIAERYAQQTGIALAPTVEALTFGMQEDFVILHDEADVQGMTMRARFLSVCFPSNWDPLEKANLDFAAIHEPVADNTALQAGAKGIVDMAFRKSSMMRHVWLLSPASDLAMHPKVRQRYWQDALAQCEEGATLLSQVYMRVERQTTLPLPDLKRGVFFIRVMLSPLPDVLQVAPTRAVELADAIESMSAAVIQYRGMSLVRNRLLEELRRFDA